LQVVVAVVAVNLTGHKLAALVVLVAVVVLLEMDTLQVLLVLAQRVKAITVPQVP
jgi:hypothetical protein